MSYTDAFLETISRKASVLLKAQTGTCKANVKPQFKSESARPQADVTSDRERQAMARLYIDYRFSSYQIAEVFSRHPTGVLKQLRKAGIKCRSLSEAAKGR